MKRKDYKKEKKKMKQVQPIEQEWEEEAEVETYWEILKDLFKTKWFLALLGLLFASTFAVGHFLFFGGNTGQVEKQLDLEAVIPNVDYTLTLQESGDKTLGIVVSEELQEKDAVTLSDVIREQEGKNVRLMVFDAEPTITKEPGFYTDGLRFDVTAYPDNRYETRTFYPVPSIESGVEGVHRWNIDAEQSYLDTENVLHVKADVPTLVSTEDSVALFKGISHSIEEMNKPKTFSDIIFRVKSGIRKMDYSMNHPNVIADVNMYQMEQVTKGE